jgi:hypothetical protein
MVQGLAPAIGGLDKDFKVFQDLFLTGKIVKIDRSQRPLDIEFGGGKIISRWV